MQNLQMALNTSEMRSNRIEIASFSEELQKIIQQPGAKPPRPRLWHFSVTLQ